MNADNDEISDNDVVWEDNNISEDEEHNATEVVDSKIIAVVSKIIATKAKQPKVADGAKYSCNKWDHTWKMKHGQKEKQYLIKAT